jgi:hypothetical protein
MDSRIFDIVTATLATKKLTAEMELETVINGDPNSSVEEITQKIMCKVSELVDITSQQQLWVNLLKQTQQRPEEANNNKKK